jgi:hypothetical protein
MSLENLKDNMENALCHSMSDAAAAKGYIEAGLEELQNYKDRLESEELVDKITMALVKADPEAPYRTLAKAAIKVIKQGI